MLKKVRDFPYILPNTFSSALIFLLTEVCKCNSLLSDLHTAIYLNEILAYLSVSFFIGTAFVQESSDPAS